MPSLFRLAALDAQRSKCYGEIILVRPISFSLLTFLASGMAMLIIGALVFGTYTKRATISGQLVPDIGVVKVYASQPGIVLSKHVQEGMRYKKGAVLFVVSSERRSSTPGGIQEKISRQVELREQSLREELRQTQTLHRAEEVALNRKIRGIEVELINVSNQLQGQVARVELAEATVRRAEELRQQGYFSADLAQQKQADLLDQRNKLEALKRDRNNVQRDLFALRSELQTLPLRQKSQTSQIERLITSTNQELVESEGKRTISVIAPVNGIATGIAAEEGQTVDGTSPLVSILPKEAVLQAHLYAPSRTIGFIRPGNGVLLRYQSYPYQKFGHARGVVISISRTALSPSELGGRATPTGPGSEPLYRIIVRLERQTITAYGQPQPLQAGMLVDADVLQEKRRLFEWVLEPLYSLTGML